jgi:hypothetical protein
MAFGAWWGEGGWRCRAALRRRLAYGRIEGAVFVRGEGGPYFGADGPSHRRQSPHHFPLHASGLARSELHGARRLGLLAPPHYPYAARSSCLSLGPLEALERASGPCTHAALLWPLLGRPGELPPPPALAPGPPRPAPTPLATAHPLPPQLPPSRPSRPPSTPALTQLNTADATDAPAPKGLLSWLPPANERKKLLPLGMIFFCILFNYTILRDTKDVLMITAKGSGAEVIPFLKVSAAQRSGSLASVGGNGQAASRRPPANPPFPPNPPPSPLTHPSPPLRPT